MYRVYRKSDDTEVGGPYNVVSAAQAIGFYVSKVIKEPWRRNDFYARQEVVEPAPVPTPPPARREQLELAF